MEPLELDSQEGGQPGATSLLGGRARREGRRHGVHAVQPQPALAHPGLAVQAVHRRWREREAVRLPRRDLLAFS